MASLAMSCGFSCAALMLFATISASACASHIEERQPPYDYSEGLLGPTSWGNLQKDWSLCGVGKSQSPLDINKTQALQRKGTRLVHSYRMSIAKINTTYGLKLIMEEGRAYTHWYRKRYVVTNMHWHTPSEHTLDGERFPLEGHIVHRGESNDTLVVSILYTYGEEDKFLTSIMNRNSSRINDTLKIIKSKFYSYEGSLTTPPCSEPVTWIILNKGYNVSKHQVRHISRIIQGHNARPLQSLNGRIIYKFNFL